jgi:prepilin-type N-terminal cleavage/methylation domain-containing protein
MNKHNFMNNINPRAGRLARGFTLLEVLVVVVVLGILVSFAMPAFFQAQTRIHENEANATFGLITNAERMIQIESKNFASCNGNANCAANLNTDIPAGYWSFAVNTVSPPQDFCAAATHGTTIWYFCNDSIAMSNTTCMAGCP